MKRGQRHPATVLTLKRIRDDGWRTVEVAEHYVTFPAPGHRVDLFGFVDVLAVGPRGTLAVQATSYGGVSDRLRKARTERADPIQDMLAAGWDLRLWGWHQPRGPRTAWILKREVHLREYFAEHQITNEGDIGND